MNTSTFDRSYFVKGEPIEERRSSLRARIMQIVYMNVQEENGGIVLDVSFTGLGFQVAAPVPTDKQVGFRLSVEGIDGMELLGDVMWLDSTRMRGGLRFGHLPDLVRKNIQEWIGASPAEVPKVPESMMMTPNANAIPPRQDPPSPETGHSFDVNDGVSLYTRNLDQPRPVSPKLFVTEFPSKSLPGLLESTWNSPRLGAPEQWDDATHRKRRLGAVALTILLVLIVTAGAFAFRNKREAGESLIRLGERLSGERPRQSVQPEFPAAASSSSSSSYSIAQPSAVPETTERPADGTGSLAAANPADSPSATGNPVQPSVAGPQIESSEASPSPTPGQARPARSAEASGVLNSSSVPAQPETATALPKPLRPNSEASSQKDDGRAELAMAQQYLRGTRATNDREMAAHLLWVAVGDGNAEAELALADLFLRGDGIPKNCEQARILLNAASDTGNLAARQRLTEVGDYGCR